MSSSTYITATRRLQFSAGHRVFGHENKCANLHGHNYVVFLHARSKFPSFQGTKDQLDKLGRVIDFGVLKAFILPWIEENWDHSFIYWTRDVLLKEIRHREEVNHLRWYEADFNPTAENMAQFLLNLGDELLSDTEVELEKVVVWETENCFAEAVRK